MSDVPNWGDLNRKAEPPSNEERARLFELCAEVFSSAPGRQLMVLLRKTTIETRTPYNADEATLRTMEARRGLVFDMEKWRDAGLAMTTKKPKPPA